MRYSAGSGNCRPRRPAAEGKRQAAVATSRCKVPIDVADCRHGALPRGRLPSSQSIAFSPGAVIGNDGAEETSQFFSFSLICGAVHAQKLLERNVLLDKKYVTVPLKHARDEGGRISSVATGAVLLIGGGPSQIDRLGLAFRRPHVNLLQGRRCKCVVTCQPNLPRSKRPPTYVARLRPVIMASTRFSRCMRLDMSTPATCRPTRPSVALAVTSCSASTHLTCQYVGVVSM